MPNWCENRATITAPTVEMAEKLANAYNAGALFEGLVPTPKEVLSNESIPVKNADDSISVYNVLHDSEYSWRLNNWGTKWDVGVDSEDDDRAEVDGCAVTLYFDSAWSPPIAFYQAIEALGYVVDASYNESGMAFCGIYADGEEHEFTYPSGATCSADFASHLPAQIMDEYSFDWLDESDDEDSITSTPSMLLAQED